MNPEDALKKILELGPVLLMAYFQDKDKLMKVVTQLPYVKNMRPRAGTECQTFSGRVGEDSTTGFTLFTGGGLTSEEARTATDLIIKYSDGHMFTVPESFGIIKRI